MTLYTIPYGFNSLSFDLPTDLKVDWIEPAYVPPTPDPLRVVQQSILQPVDNCPLTAFGKIRSVAVAVNDKTRPVPHEYLLPPLLEQLRAMGVSDDAVRILIAMGTHLPMPESEFSKILPGEIIDRFRIISHNCDDEENLVYLGKTTRGTPILVNRQFMEADLRIVVGNIEPHHFAGFSGGVKTAAIGLTGRKTINHNHALLVDPGARIAVYDQNPLRQDIEEIGDAINVQIALNAILNGDKKIVQVVAGSPRQVMRAGIPISQSYCQIPNKGGYDLVIASVGGAPKDINFYQSQKALSHASLFTRDGGVIVLASACPEGSGSASFESFMIGLKTPQAVFEKFTREGFQVGPHKAFQVARDAARIHIILISEIPGEKVQDLLMTPASTLQEGILEALRRLAPAKVSDLKVAILPRATNTIPV